MPRSSNERVKAVIAGFLGSLGLVLFYFLITVLITGNPQFPVNQFLAYKYLMTPLVIGFGIQIGLFSYLRLCGKNNLGAKISTGTSGGVSGVSMVACCAHHLAEVLPILGLSGASLFLASFQKELLILGVASNLLGIFLITRDLKKS